MMATSKKPRTKGETTPASTDPPSGTGSKAVNFRADMDLMGRLTMIAKALDLDVSSVVRMVLASHLHEYEAKAIQILRSRAASKEV